MNRITILAAGILTFAGSALAGTFISATPDPLGAPTFGFGITGGPVICFPTICTGNNYSHDYTYVSKTFGTDEVAQTTATFTGSMYDTGMNYLGDYSATGHVDFRFYGRTSETDGTWNAEIIRDDVTISAFGHTVDITLDPGQTSTGTLSVALFNPFNDTQAEGGGLDSNSNLNQQVFYAITATFGVHALFSVDPGQPGGFTSAPAPFGLDLADLSQAPEPGTWQLFGSSLAAAWGLRRRTRR